VCSLETNCELPAVTNRMSEKFFPPVQPSSASPILTETLSKQYFGLSAYSFIVSTDLVNMQAVKVSNVFSLGV